MVQVDYLAAERALAQDFTLLGGHPLRCLGELGGVNPFQWCIGVLIVETVHHRRILVRPTAASVRHAWQTSHTNLRYVRLLERCHACGSDKRCAASANAPWRHRTNDGMAAGPPAQLRGPLLASDGPPRPL